MNHKPLLSVIIANYNNEQFIRKCLDSVLGQSYKDIEIVVADDCSTDNSNDIIREYEKKYTGMIRTVSLPANRGPAYARHEAILNAKGDYITTLDSDDYYYDSQKLEKEMELIEYYGEKENKDIIAFSNVIFVDRKRQVIGPQWKAESIREGMILNDIITRSCMIPRDFIMKKSAYFDIGGYDLSFETHEDWDLKIRLAAKYQYFYTGINGTAYRRNGAGLSSTPHCFRSRNLLKVFNKNIHLISTSVEKRVTEETFLLFMNKRELNFMDNLFNRFQVKFRDDLKLGAIIFYFRNLVYNFGFKGFYLFFKELLRRRNQYAKI